MSDSELAFTHVKNGVTFNVRLNGWPPNYGFIINAEYKGVPLFTLHHKHRFVYSVNSRLSLLETAENIFRDELSVEMYNLAANTAHRMKEECYRPYGVK